MKRMIMLILTLALALFCATAQAREFTDSTGRTLTLPDTIERVAVSGPAAQIVVFALAPDMLVGISSAWDSDDLPYVGEYADLPVLGQLYGGKGNMNLEQIAVAAPQIVIDVGETKESVAQELDELGAQVGIPFVHVGITTDTAAQTFRMLGELLGREEDAERLAAYCEETLARVAGVMDSVGEKKARFIYCLGEEGLSVLARGSYHAEIIDRLTENVAVVESPSSRGTGNAVDMEQMVTWNPDYIVFSPDSEDVRDNPVWAGVAAVAQGHYAKVPSAPYNWMGYPPCVQRYLGMLWLCDLLYPDAADIDMELEVARFYSLFYHCELTAEQVEALLAEARFQ